MRNTLLLILLFTASTSFAQSFSFDEMLELGSMPQKKVENFITKKGFVIAGRTWQNDTIIDLWEEKPRRVENSSDLQSLRRISKFQNGQDISYCYQTADKAEYSNALSILKNDGYKCGVVNNSIDSSLLLQKYNVTVHGYSVKEESTTFYSLLLNKKPVPTAKSIRFAEDLMQFSSHEFLSAYFGKENVSHDLYYFSDNKISKCTILFPNTSRQVVFIWDDETNLTGLNSIVIGGSIPTENASKFQDQVVENNWILSNGLRSNMKLEELIKQNGSDLSFYGTDSEYYLKIVPEKGGYYDFAAMDVMLDCVNCSGSKLLNTEKVSGTEAYESNLNLHIALIMISTPDHKKAVERLAVR